MQVKLEDLDDCAEMITEIQRVIKEYQKQTTDKRMGMLLNELMLNTR